MAVGFFRIGRGEDLGGGGEVVEWAKGLGTCPTLIHIDMREPERTGALRKKGWAIELWQQLQLALPMLRAIGLIPARETVHSLLEVMSTHGADKLKSGVCTVYPTTNLIHCPLRRDMIAVDKYFPNSDPQREQIFFPLSVADSHCSVVG